MRYLAGFSALLAAGNLLLSTEGEAQTRRVVVNAVRLPDAQVQGLERQYRISLADGDYWYDQSSGAWGVSGGRPWDSRCRAFRSVAPFGLTSRPATPGCSSMAGNCTSTT